MCLCSPIVQILHNHSSLCDTLEWLVAHRSLSSNASFKSHRYRAVCSHSFISPAAFNHIQHTAHSSQTQPSYTQTLSQIHRIIPRLVHFCSSFRVPQCSHTLHFYISFMSGIMSRITGRGSDDSTSRAGAGSTTSGTGSVGTSVLSSPGQTHHNTGSHTPGVSGGLTGNDVRSTGTTGTATQSGHHSHNVGVGKAWDHGKHTNTCSWYAHITMNTWHRLTH